MQEWSKSQNLHDSVYKALESYVSQTQAKWTSEKGSTFTLELKENAVLELGALSGILNMVLLDDSGDSTDNSLRSSAILQLDCVTKKNIAPGYLFNNFVRSYIFFLLGFRDDRRVDENGQKYGFIPFKNYWKYDNPLTEEDQIIARLQDGRGWVDLKPGQPGAPLKDSSLVHYCATLLLSY